MRRFHRQGVGRLLLCSVARRFLQRGVSSMLLFGDAASPSNRFYDHPRTRRPGARQPPNGRAARARRGLRVEGASGAWRARFFDLAWVDRPGGRRAAVGLAASRRVAELHRVTLALDESDSATVRLVLTQQRNFYLRVKGEAEDAVAAIGFSAVRVLRPGLLLGARAEHRAGEAIAQLVMPWFAPALAGPLRRYRPISAEIVGRAMVAAALDGRAGHAVLYFDEIQAAAARA